MSDAMQHRAVYCILYIRRLINIAHDYYCKHRRLQGIFQDLEHGGVNQPFGGPFSSRPSFAALSLPSITLPPHSPFLRSRRPPPSPAFPSSSFSSFLLPPLRSGVPEIQLGSLGSAVSSPSGSGQSRNRLWCVFALKSDLWWQQF